MSQTKENEEKRENRVQYIVKQQNSIYVRDFSHFPRSQEREKWLKYGFQGGSRGGYTNDIPHPRGWFYSTLRPGRICLFSDFSLTHFNPPHPGMGGGGVSGGDFPYIDEKKGVKMGVFPVHRDKNSRNEKNELQQGDKNCYKWERNLERRKKPSRRGEKKMISLATKLTRCRQRRSE